MKKSLFIFLLLTAFHLTIGAQEPSKGMQFSEAVASGNDWILEKGQQHPLLSPFVWVTSRTMSLTVFPISTAVDLTVLGAKQAKETAQLLFIRDQDERTKHLQKYNKNRVAMEKATLGLLATPFAVISPDLVTHHFVPANIQKYSVTPYGKLYSVNAHVAYPESIEDVQAIVREAGKSGKTISIIGSSMSQGKQAISNHDWNVVINTSKLNHIEIDPALRTARVGSGAIWKDLQNAANEHGLAVQVMQASNIFSIGGSISANCHGWDHTMGSLRHTIIDIVIVDAEGDVQIITPSDPIFDYVVGGYGGFGVIVEATLALTDNLLLREQGVEIKPANYVSYFENMVRNDSSIKMHLYRLSLEPKRLFKTGIAVNYVQTNDEPIIAKLSDEPAKGSRIDRIKIHTLRRLSWLHNYAWKTEKKNALIAKTHSRNEIMRPPINPIFNNSNLDTEWLQEYFVKGENLEEFLEYLGGVLTKNHVPVFNASVRFVKHDPNSKLSYAKDGDRYAIVLFFNQKLTKNEIAKTESWVCEVIDYLIAHDGTFYLPYQHFATTDQFHACYPNWRDVAAYKLKVDPQGVFDNGLYADYITAQPSKESLFRDVLTRTGGQRDEIRDFINNVFMQLDDKAFFTLIDSILKNPELDDDQIYEQLFEHINKAQFNRISSVSAALTSLHALKEDLGNQTATLVGSRPIKGYVEIGYPGRMVRPLELRLNMSGPVYVITDAKRSSDYIEAGFPLPYDHFVKLGNYEPISENAIPTASVDLVCMYIGLHHIPEEQIDGFLASIRRILRPGGSFILMDHDAHTPELQKMVDVVHSIFNAGTGVRPEENKFEVRNFQSLEYWTHRVTSSGFVLYAHDPLIRDGDSTLNSLIRFDKPKGDISPESLTEAVMVENSRALQKTYLTAPEWQNVRSAQRYSEFLKNNSANEFPFFSEIGAFWKVYGNSWNSAQKECGFTDVAFSEHNLMNLFVGTSMSLEYGLKGIAAIPLRFGEKLFGSDKTNASAQEQLRSRDAYGKFIVNTPFYQYPYFGDISKYWKTYATEKKSVRSGIKGFLSGIAMTGEYALKGLVSVPMSLVYGSEALKEDEIIHVLFSDPQDHIHTPNYVVIGSYPEYSLKHVQLPRYMKFTETMIDLAADSTIECVNIAGQTKIQLDVKCPNGNQKALAGLNILYEIPAPTDQFYTYSAVEVEASQLLRTIRSIFDQNAEVIFIHDF